MHTLKAATRGKVECAVQVNLLLRVEGYNRGEWCNARDVGGWGGGGGDTLHMIADVVMSEQSRGGKRNDRTGK